MGYKRLIFLYMGFHDRRFQPLTYSSGQAFSIV
jgi:hypothetical protein